MLKEGWRRVLTPVCASAFAAFCAALFVDAGSNWYLSLIKPAITPPDMVFTIVWGGVYALCAVAAVIVLMNERAESGGVFYLFGLCGAINALWMYLFFEKHLLASSLFCSMLAALLAVLTARRVERIQRSAMLLMLPYLVWIAYSLALNYAITMLN